MSALKTISDLFLEGGLLVKSSCSNSLLDDPPPPSSIRSFSYFHRTCRKGNNFTSFIVMAVNVDWEDRSATLADLQLEFVT